MSFFFSSLYLHVPFCERKCSYCGFYSVPFNEVLQNLYLEAILSEMALTKDIPHRVKTLYIGGGSPSCLSENSIEMLFKGLRENYEFAEDCEITLEINPHKIEIEKLKFYKSIGINRISVGVQSFIDRELAILGRLHKAHDAIRTVERILNLGIKNLSIDLIYGIPGQTLSCFEYSLKIACLPDIKHISIYELDLYRGTKLYEQAKKGEISLLEDSIIEEMYIFATEYLQERGFYKYEISNFAKQNFECKHNINYWTLEPYLGLGPSASSFIGNVRFHNPSDINEYIRQLKQGELAWIEDYKVYGPEKLKEKIFLGLRMKRGVFIENPCLIEIFRDLEKVGLAKLNKNQIKLTDRGMLLSNEIFCKVLLHIESCPVCKGG